MIEISEYTPDDRRAVIDLILDIQNNEFGIAITEEQQPDLQDIPSFYQHGNGNFWVAMHQGIVVGSISLLDIGNGESALRSKRSFQDVVALYQTICSAHIMQGSEQLG